MAGVPAARPLPGWESSTGAGRLILLFALALAPVLLAGAASRIVASGAVGPWHLLLVVSALAAADLLSGLVHWAADTWGSEHWPVVGPRLLRPFRLHHVNPDDLLRRSFVDCNGDVAVISSAVLGLTLLMPVHAEPWVSSGLFLVALAGWILPVNQVHQWAHDPDAPAPVRVLQRLGLVLDRRSHAVHHRAPYATHYCILTGWWNRPLAAVDFFPRLERLVSGATGLRPRGEDDTFAAAHLGTGDAS